MKRYWISFHVPDEAVRKALKTYDKVKDLSREERSTEGFDSVQSTRRLVMLSLKEDVTQERLPHQLRSAGVNVLVVVPGRAPLCHRWKGTGCIRRKCRVLKCDECHRFAHESENSTSTYAAVTQAVVEMEDGALDMDEEEAEEVTRDVVTEVHPMDSVKGTPDAEPDADLEGAEFAPEQQKDAVEPDPSQSAGRSAGITPIGQVSALEGDGASKFKVPNKDNASEYGYDISDASEGLSNKGTGLSARVLSGRPKPKN